MKKFHELVAKYTALASTKDVAQWCVYIELDVYLFSKRIKTISNEKV